MTDAPLTPERRAEIVERYGTAREAAGYGNCESAIRDSLNDIPDLLSQVVRLVGELERSVSDHEACIEIIHKSDDQMERFLKVINDMRTSHGRHPSVPPTHCFICAVLNAFAALDAKEPTP